MRGRPLCAAFLCMIAFLSLLRILGIPVPGTRVWDEETLLRISESESLCVSGTVTEKNVYDDGVSYLISGSVLELEERTVQTGSITLYFKNTEPVLPIDSKIRAYGKLTKYEHAANDGGFDACEYYAADDRYFKMTCERTEVLSSPAFSIRRVFAELRLRMKEVLAEGAGEESGAVLAAMMLGDKGSVSDESALNFSSAGLSHLLAISGLHVSLIGMGILVFLKKMSLNQYAACAVSVSFLIFYTVFTGAREATVRALIMFAVMAVGKCALRSYDPVSSLSAAGIIVLILRPSSLFLSGFQFSFAAAFGAAVICPVLIKKLKLDIYGRGKIRGILCSAAMVWISVQIATVPVMLWNYYEFPVLSIFPNMIFVPLMSLVMLLGFAGVLIGMLFPGTAQVILFLPSVLIRAMEGTGAFLRKLPFGSVVTGQPSLFQIGLYVLGTVLFLLVLSGKKKMRKKLLAASFAAFAFIFVNLRSGFSIAMLDIGQGDCIVIQNDSACFLMDAGSTSKDRIGSNILLPYLKFHGVTRINAAFVSHADLDHISGITELFEMKEKNETRIEIERLVLPAVMKIYAESGDEQTEQLISCGGSCEEGVTFVNTGDAIRSDDLILKVIAPGTAATGNRNEDSLVMTASIGGFTALFTGDIGGEAEEEIIGMISHCDVLKVAHHGSSGSTSEAFLSRVTPFAALVSCGKNNLYGHPHAETVEALKAAGSDIYCTAECGQITVKTDPSGHDSFTVRTLK